MTGGVEHEYRKLDVGVQGRGSVEAELQRRFDIDPEETALTLNAKCFEAGGESFVELVAEFDGVSYEAREQDLSRRTLYKLSDRPIAACGLASGLAIGNTAPQVS